ncbi:aminopeptidase, partial [Bacillus paranthracis]|nr:aminopeptidase [Bacillus paranthracis]
MKKSLKQKIVSSLLAVSLAVSLAPIGQAKADSTSEITQTSSITKQIDASRAI